MKAKINQLPKGIVFWGGTGQAKVMRSIVEHYGSRVAAVIDDTVGLKPPFQDTPLLLGKEGFLKLVAKQNKSELGFLITIGNPHGKVRLGLHEYLSNEGLLPVSLAHPTAWISSSAVIGEGAQIHAGAIIETEARLGRAVIVNTNASVDHECVLEDGSEIAPGATLCGLVTVKKHGWVCAGATVLPRKTIGENAIVAAGAVVTRDVASGTTVMGVPATLRG